MGYELASVGMHVRTEPLPLNSIQRFVFDPLSASKNIVRKFQNPHAKFSALSSVRHLDIATGALLLHPKAKKLSACRPLSRHDIISQLSETSGLGLSGGICCSSKEFGCRSKIISLGGTIISLADHVSFLFHKRGINASPRSVSIFVVVFRFSLEETRIWTEAQRPGYQQNTFQILQWQHWRTEHVMYVRIGSRITLKILPFLQDHSPRRGYCKQNKVSGLFRLLPIHFVVTIFGI